MPILDFSIVRKDWVGPFIIDASYNTGETHFKVANQLLGNAIWLVEARDILNPKGLVNQCILEREISRFDFDNFLETTRTHSKKS